MCSLVTELLCTLWRVAATVFLVTTSQIWQYFRCFFLICVFLCCCFCLGESFAQCFGAFGSVGVHVFLTSLKLWLHGGHARLCCSMLSRGQISSSRELYFLPVCVQKWFVWAFRAKCNFLSFCFSLFAWESILRSSRSLMLIYIICSSDCRTNLKCISSIFYMCTSFMQNRKLTLMTTLLTSAWCHSWNPLKSVVFDWMLLPWILFICFYFFIYIFLSPIQRHYNKEWCTDKVCGVLSVLCRTTSAWYLSAFLFGLSVMKLCLDSCVFVSVCVHKSEIKKMKHNFCRMSRN